MLRALEAGECLSAFIQKSGCRNLSLQQPEPFILFTIFWTLEVRPSAKELISEAGFDEKYGARPLKRAIQTKVEDALAQEILEGRVKTGDTVAVGIAKKEVKFVVKHHKELEKNEDLC